jgi:hypothetical protein
MGRPQTCTPEQKALIVDYALSLMDEDYRISGQEAAGVAGREAIEDITISADSVMRWARELGKGLHRVGGEAQKAAGDARARYSRAHREDQRARLLALIDLEMERTEIALRSPRNTTKDGLAVNFSQRLQALATAHGTIASHSRSDELHALRMGDIDPEKPADSLEDWDGNPNNYPADLEAKVIDLAATRRLAASLSQHAEAN